MSCSDTFSSLSVELKGEGGERGVERGREGGREGGRGGREGGRVVETR